MFLWSLLDVLSTRDTKGSADKMQLYKVHLLLGYTFTTGDKRLQSSLKLLQFAIKTEFSMILGDKHAGIKTLLKAVNIGFS